MTRKFNQVYENILHETLVGSKKRNKLPGMGRKGGKQRDLAHARAQARQLKKHAAHIRPSNKVTGNETGVHSKRPDSKPVYANKNGIKPMTNTSQRTLPKGKRPYSSNHTDRGVTRKLKDDREKIMRDLENGN
jgi:hypothetical protein|tara:strand:+ start:141 stop:539 length:399 start_codon:yes stop_codon:yes gene_type:complete